MQKIDEFQKLSKMEKLMLFTVLALTIVALLVAKNSTAATFTTPTSGGTGVMSSVYVTVSGWVYGAPGLIIGLGLIIFGVFMGISKHFMMFFIFLIAAVLLFLAPSIVIGIATAAASVSGAVI
jgi:hypothetical protein